MGLYLLLLLSQGDYAGFHTLLEGLEVAARGLAVEGEDGSGSGDAKMKGVGDEEGAAKANPLEDDEFIQYPIRLEQALMEGSYDRVWGETKDERVPSEEYKVFSKVRGVLHVLSVFLPPSKKSNLRFYLSAVCLISKNYYLLPIAPLEIS